MERLRKRYNERENEWGDKLHTEMNRRGELLKTMDAKFESLVKERDEAREEKRKVEAERDAYSTSNASGGCEKRRRRRRES